MTSQQGFFQQQLTCVTAAFYAYVHSDIGETKTKKDLNDRIKELAKLAKELE